jgi:hypothetical protein
MALVSAELVADDGGAICSDVCRSENLWDVWTAEHTCSAKALAQVPAALSLDEKFRLPSQRHKA